MKAILILITVSKPITWGKRKEILPTKNSCLSWWHYGEKPLRIYSGELNLLQGSLIHGAIQWFHKQVYVSMLSCHLVEERIALFFNCELFPKLCYHSPRLNSRNRISNWISFIQGHNHNSSKHETEWILKVFKPYCIFSPRKKR